MIEPVTCRRCAGRGSIPSTADEVISCTDEERYRVTCPDCDGSGKVLPYTQDVQKALQDHEAMEAMRRTRIGACYYNDYPDEPAGWWPELPFPRTREMCESVVGPLADVGHADPATAILAAAQAVEAE